jgi:thioesterase domain-containing protein
MALSAQARWGRAQRGLRDVWQRSARIPPHLRRVEVRDIIDDVAPIPLVHQRLMQVHIHALSRYVPQPYAGRVTVFRTARQPLFCSHDPLMGWGLWAGRVDVRQIRGSHHNILEEPHVHSLAAELRAALEAAREGR